jgi:hypothetical protein
MYQCLYLFLFFNTVVQVMSVYSQALAPSHGPNIYKLACKGIWRQLFICLEAPSPPKFLVGVLKQFCRFGTWSNTQCITPVLSTQPDHPPPPCYTLYEYMPPVLIHTGKGGGVGEPVRRLEVR